MFEIPPATEPEAAPAADPVSTSRDARGRFRPGCSGNPAGKRPGTRHAKTILEAAITGEEGHQAARVVIEAAVEGDKASARWLVGRLDGKPRGRLIEFAVDDNGNMTAGLDAAFRGIMDGTVTIDEAWSLMRWVQAYRDLVPPRRWMDSPLRADEPAAADPGDAAVEAAPADPAAAVEPAGGPAADPACDALAAPILAAWMARRDVGAGAPDGASPPANHLHPAGAGGSAAAAPGTGLAPPPAGNRAMRRRAAALARAAA